MQKVSSPILFQHQAEEGFKAGDNTGSICVINQVYACVDSVDHRKYRKNRKCAAVSAIIGSTVILTPVPWPDGS